MTTVRLPLVAVLAALVSWGAPLAAQQPGNAAPGEETVGADSLAELVGVVASAETGKEIEGALVTVPKLDLSFTSDAAGRFELRGVPPGSYEVRVQYLGYSTNERTVPAEPGRRTRVVFLLDRDVLEIADLEVEVKRVDRSEPGSAFRQRMRERRFGVFVTREEIEEREPYVISEMLRGIPDVEVAPVEWGQATVFMRGSNGDLCEPAVFLNGVSATGFTLDNLSPDAVEGIEVYRRPSEVPAEFKGVGTAGCGALVIWSQTGELSSTTR